MKYLYHTMKHLFFILWVVLALASCKKDKDVPAATTVLMSQWEITNGTNTIAEAYSFDAGNKLSGSVYNNTEFTNTPVTYSYTADAAGKITRADKKNKDGAAAGYNTYEYDASGRLAKISYFNAAGALSSYYGFLYAGDHYERVSYSAAGVAGSKTVFYYTPDKKNIAVYKQYTSKGDLYIQVDYTRLASRNPESIYPYSEMYILETGFVSENAVDAAATTYGAATYTTTYTYTYDAAGYPLTHKEVYSSGEEPSTATYKYVVK